MRFEKWGITVWLGAAQAAVSALLLAALGTGEEAIRLWIRVTAWMSATCFLLAFGARPLRQLWRVDATKSLLANRRYVGVSGAFAHLIHGIAIAWLIAAVPVAWEQTDLQTLVFGGLGFVFYFAMGLTSSDAAVARLGRARWRRLHTVGGYYVWFIFAFPFLGTVANGAGWKWVVSTLFFAGFVALLALRLFLRLRSTSPAPA